MASLAYQHSKYHGHRLILVAVALCVVAACILASFAGQPCNRHVATGRSGGSSKSCHETFKFIPPIRNRDALGALLQAEGFKVGAELGVAQGAFARATLTTWTACERFYLVDLWAPQANYKDLANTDKATQDQTLQTAKQTLAPWSGKLVWLRNYTTQAVHQVPEALSYIYVDARHDYCGVMDDLRAWWPKLSPGGIMAGHDYMTNSEVQAATPEQDWSLCGNGTVHVGAVVSAVNDFFSSLNVQVVVAYREGSFNTWLVRKPSLVCTDNTQSMLSVSAMGSRL